MNHTAIQSNRETAYFIISLVISILVYILVLVSVIGIAIALGIFAFVLFANAMMLGSIRGNGVRIHERQFPDVYESVQSLSKQIGLKNVPDVFVIQSEGALNAFATRFFGRDMVVLYSEVFELAREQGKEELDFIIAHELAHIKRRHVWKNILLMPAGFIPFLSQAYSRSCEYTCDRHAAYLIQNAPAAKRALTLLGIGKKMYVEVNDDAYREQIRTESNGFVWLSEVLSSHPRLPKRIQAIQQFEGSGERLYTPDHGKIVFGMMLIGGAGMAVYFISILLLAGGTLVFSQFANEFPDPYSIEEDSFYSEDYSYEGQTELMSAASAGDITAIDRALADGEDLLARDSEGSDALMYAVYSGQSDIVAHLIDAGADVNTADDYATALTNAIMYGDTQTALILMEYGADPYLSGADGMNALEYAGAATPDELYATLQSGEY
ncbi:M48 family metallopeptidase [Planococcus halotolerans]|uniref:M48 family metallopeptidase n=1 Tax=Planococcus halotolerans TaxID=2233542 RepID=UPI001092D882|nr:M48 family metallopeptidase [Planococcus halotolerans]QHJ71383.1 M48 family metalloprotease [Planococcus halotolerans]